MTRNASNIIRHEFMGLFCDIAKSKNRSQEGVSGRVVDETMKIIVIETKKGRKRIQKRGTIFRFCLSKAKVCVNGNYIIARPEDRIKKKFKKW